VPEQGLRLQTRTRIRRAGAGGKLIASSVKRRYAILGLAVPAIAWLSAGALLSEGALQVRSWEPVARRFRPPQLPPAAGREAEIQAADGVILRGSFFAPRAPGADCVILLHGVADSRAAAAGFAPMFLEAGYAALAPDLRAHGRSGGERTTYGILESDDIRRWAAWMRRQGCERRFGLGFSLGGAALILAAVEPGHFDAIAAECSYRSFRSVAEDRLAQRLVGPPPFVRAVARSLVRTGFAYARIRHGWNLEEASPENAARAMKTPLLLIHGLSDAETPPEHSRALAQAAPNSELWLVPGARHVSAAAAKPDEFRARVLGWFEPFR
jgi:alpha-beta hydrolase superfamily lysophospholipase